MVVPREREHEYDIDHGGDLFYIRTNGDGFRNFRLVVASVDDPGRPALAAIPYGTRGDRSCHSRSGATVGSET